MGANIVPNGSGATFRCWAPRARQVAIHGEFNQWGATDDGLLYQDGPYWSGFVADAKEGQQYKFFVTGIGTSGYKRDPSARELTRNPSYPSAIACCRIPNLGNGMMWSFTLRVSTI